MARARLRVWNNDLQEGEEAYEALLLDHPESFEVLMGTVEAKRANRRLDAAFDYLQRARQILPDQPDAYRLWQEMALADRMTFQLNGSLLEDSGGNVGQQLSARVDL